jgi:hypothetical protein
MVLVLLSDLERFAEAAKDTAMVEFIDDRSLFQGGSEGARETMEE